MSKYSLNPNMELEVIIRFITKGIDAPLTGKDYRVRLYDKDFVGVDYLGESSLDSNGAALIRFSQRAFGEWNNLEQQPDLYFILFRNETEIFRSIVMQDLDLTTLEQFKMGEGEVIDLGTFLVEG